MLKQIAVLEPHLSALLSAWPQGHYRMILIRLPCVSLTDAHTATPGSCRERLEHQTLAPSPLQKERTVTQSSCPWVPGLDYPGHIITPPSMSHETKRKAFYLVPLSAKGVLRLSILENTGWWVGTCEASVSSLG